MRPIYLQVGLLSAVLATTGTASAQTATFSGFDDNTGSARCYDPATTAPDPTNPNRLVIGMAPCVASSPTGAKTAMDTLNFQVAAPDGYYVSRITFTQSGSTSGSRGGSGFRGATWVVDKTPLAVPATGGGWAATVDLSLHRKTVFPVAITTYLAAFGIQVVSGSATASNPVVLVELAPLQ